MSPAIDLCWTAMRGIDDFVNLGSPTSILDTVAGQWTMQEGGEKSTETSDWIIGTPAVLRGQLLELLDL